MRVVDVDETGHDAKQPTVAVTGVLVDPDQPWKVLAERVGKLREQVPDYIQMVVERLAEVDEGDEPVMPVHLCGLRDYVGPSHSH